MQDGYSPSYAPRLRTVEPAVRLTKADPSLPDAASIRVGALDEITKRIASANGRLYDLTLRARRIADAAFGGSEPNEPDPSPRPAPATKVAMLDEAASVTHRILSELDIELERLAQL